MAEKGLSRVSRLTRGAVSKRTGMNIETIRYYERAGLMPDPARSPGGHRLYDEKRLGRNGLRCRPSMRSGYRVIERAVSTVPVAEQGRSN